MNITNLFQRIWPWSGSDQAPCPDQAPKEIAAPTLEPALKIELSPGWDSPLENPVDIDKVRAHDMLIYGVKSSRETVEKAANRAALLDGSPQDLNPEPGVVLVEGSDLPGHAYRNPSSVMVVFDDEHHISKADVRFRRKSTYDGAGGGEERALFERTSDGKQILRNETDMTIRTGLDNHFEERQYSLTYTVNPDGSILKKGNK